METMQTINLIFSLVILAAFILVVKYYLPSYFKKKAENLANKQDVADITREVENVKMGYTLEIERVKAELSKNAFMHKLQFETEFQAFKDIWGKLLDVRSKTLSLRPMMDTATTSPEDSDSRKDARLKAFADSFNSFVELAEKNKPFYPPDIWRALESIFKIARDEAIGYQYSDFEHDGRKYWDDAMKHREQILNGIDSVCDAIRARVEGLKTP